MEIEYQNTLSLDISNGEKKIALPLTFRHVVEKRDP